MNTRIETVLFDLDGTVIDTEVTAALAVREIYSQWDVALKKEDAAYVTGRTWNSAFEYLFAKYPVPVPQDQAKRTIMTHYRDLLEKDLVTVPGSVQAIQSLASTFKLALVSGSQRSDILWALKKLKVDHHFQVILGAEDYPRSKPEPDGYLKAMTTLNSDSKNCLVFEDSTAGIASGRAAGAWVVAVTSTNHFQLNLSQAHMKINDLTPVNVEWVRNLSFD